jgi:fructose-1,6-bisphosphatase II
MDGIVVIGEGEKDEAPMLYNGERVGTGRQPEVDIAVDPVEGTRLLAEGRHGATSLIAAAPRGSMLDPGPMVYMMKYVVGGEAAGVVDIDAPVKDNPQDRKGARQGPQRPFGGDARPPAPRRR